MKLKIKTLPHYDLKNWGLPSYGSDGAAGFDLRAAFSLEKRISIPFNHYTFYPSGAKGILSISLYPSDVVIFGTGIVVGVPNGCELQIRSHRVSENFAVGVGFLFGGEGTIDSDFRGEIMIAVRNISSEEREICHGDRIAQAILAPVFRAEWEQIDNLTETNRGENGFGSTGV